MNDERCLVVLRVQLLGSRPRKPPTVRGHRKTFRLTFVRGLRLPWSPSLLRRSRDRSTRYSGLSAPFGQNSCSRRRLKRARTVGPFQPTQTQHRTRTTTATHHNPPQPTAFLAHVRSLRYLRATAAGQRDAERLASLIPRTVRQSALRMTAILGAAGAREEAGEGEAWLRCGGGLQCCSAVVLTAKPTRN